MDKQLQDRLRRIAPDFFRAEPHSPLDQRGIEVGDGWYPVLLTLGVSAQSVLSASSKETRTSYCLSQIKQKFGNLTIYRSGQFWLGAIESAIKVAAEEASVTCERCAGPASLHGGAVLCDKHRGDRSSYFRPNIRPHTWVVEEIDGGTVGIGEFWKCSDCGASGGPCLGQESRPHWVPFLAGEDLRLAYDCDVARLQIEQYWRANPDRVR